MKLQVKVFMIFYSDVCLGGHLMNIIEMFQSCNGGSECRRSECSMISPEYPG
jgi:hypothetical protein